MARRERTVIVGANLTGGATAMTLRTEGYDGGVTLVGAEPHPPYERPPLSKEYLRGEATAESTQLRPHAWYAENDVGLRLGVRATRVDTQARAVELESGERVAFDRLVIATGARNRALAVPGADLPGVMQLRTIEDADALRGAVASRARVVVIGAGFIGCEVAASLRSMGAEVDVVEFFALPLVRVLGPQVATVLEAIHRDHGVRFHFGVGAERLEGSGRVERVVTTDGASIDCDVVVVGVGVTPVTELVEGTDLRIDNGVVVDEWCRTNVEGVYAAGDVANHLHPLFGRRMRVEHWDNALKQGALVARNVMGANEPFADPHWFWSDQFEHNIQYAGHAVDWDRVVIRGSVEARRFTAFYLKDGLVDGVVAIDRGKDVRRAAALIGARRPVADGALADEDVDLRGLVPRGERREA